MANNPDIGLLGKGGNQRRIENNKELGRNFGYLIGTLAVLSAFVALGFSIHNFMHTEEYEVHGDVNTITGGTNINTTGGTSNDPVINLDADVTGLTNLEVDNLKLDANTISSTNGNGDINILPDGSGTLTLGRDTNTKVDVNALAIELDSGGTIVTDSATTTTITSGTSMTLSSGGPLAIDTVGPDNISFGIEAAAKTITIGNDASAKVDVNALIIELDSAGGVSISADATDASAIDIDSAGGIDVDAAGAVAIDSGSTMTLTSGGLLELDSSDGVSISAEATGPSAIDIDSAGGIDIDSATTTTITSGTSMTLSSGGPLAIDTVGPDNISFGIEAAAKTITIGNDASAKVDVNALIIELDSAGGVSISADATDASAIDIDSAGGIDVDAAGAVAIDSGSTMTLTSGGLLELDSSGGVSISADGIVDIDSATTTTITSGTTMTLSSGGALAIDTVGNDSISFGIEAAAKTITIGNDASAKVDVNALIIELDSAGGVSISADATDASAIDIDSAGGIDVDAAGAVAIDSGSTMTLTSGGLLELDSSGGVSISADGIVDIDSATTTTITSGTTMTLSSGGALAIDTVGNDSISFGIEAAAKTITIGNDASAKVDVNALIIELDSAGGVSISADATDASAIDIDSAGGIDVDAAGAVAIDSGSTMTLTSGGLLELDSSGGVSISADGIVDIDSATTTTITSGTTMTLSSGGALAIDTVGNDSISFGIEAAAKTITIGNDASAKVDVNALIIELDSAGGVSISADATDASAIDIDSAGGIDVDAAGAVAIDSGSTMTLTSGGLLELDSSGGVSISADGIVDIDSATTTAITSGTNMTLTAGNALGLGSTNSIQIDSNTGSITMGAALTDGQNLILGPADATQMVFTPSGTPADEKISLTNTAGTASDAIAITATAGGVSIGAGGIVDIDSATTTTITSGTTMTLASGGLLGLDSSAGVSISADATDANAIDIDSAGGIDIDAAGAVAIDATTIGLTGPLTYYRTTSIITSVPTITVANSGTTYIINDATGFTTALPSTGITEGVWFKFVCGLASTTGNMKITASTGTRFYGKIHVRSTGTPGDLANTVPSQEVAINATAADNDTITLNGSSATSGWNVGDWIECVYTTSGWLTFGILTTTNTSPASIAVIGAL